MNSVSGYQILRQYRYSTHCTMSDLGVSARLATLAGETHLDTKIPSIHVVSQEQISRVCGITA